jgi:hypothetical protein
LREWWFSIPAAPVVVEKDNKEDKKTRWISVCLSNAMSYPVWLMHLNGPRAPAPPCKMSIC